MFRLYTKQQMENEVARRMSEESFKRSMEESLRTLWDRVFEINKDLSEIKTKLDSIGKPIANPTENMRDCKNRTPRCDCYIAREE